MAEYDRNGWKLLETGGIAENGKTWLGMPGNDWQWLQWLKMTIKGYKWLEMARNVMK